MSELPPGWASATLGEIVELVRGVTYKKEQARTAAAPGLVPMLRATNVSAELVLDENLVFVPDSVVARAQLLQVGDIVVAASSGSASVVGKSAILRHSWRGAFGAFCTVLRTKPGVDAAYVGHFVASPVVRERWSSLAAGTNINNLKRQHFVETVVPLPPLAEQRRIVAAIEEQFSRLDAADALLARTQRHLRLLRDQIAATVVGGSGTQDQIGNRTSWDVMRLAALCPVFVDCAHRTPRYASAGVPALRPRDVVGGVLRLEDAAKVDPAEFEIQTRRRVPRPGDVLYSRELSYGWAVVVPTGAALCMSQGMVLIRPSELASAEYLSLILNSPFGRRQARDAAVGTAHPHINLSDIKGYRIPVPPRPVQDEIVAFHEHSTSLVDGVSRSVDVAKLRSVSLRRSILARAFTGLLVPHGPSDEPAVALLARTTAAHESGPNRSRGGARASA